MVQSVYSTAFTDTLSCVFLNCHNLFDVGGSRGPRSPERLGRKINDLADSLRSVSKDRLPDIIGLSEVGTASLAEQVAEAISLNSYQIVWSGLPTARQGRDGGLAILFKNEVLANNAVELDNSNPAQRPKWMAVLFQLKIGTRGGFWFVVNHWKSQMGRQEVTEASRMTTAQQLGEFYLERARIVTENMVLMGDFNCEPGDKPFRQQSPNHLRAVREHKLVTRDRNRLAYFYNAMWRFLGEPENFDATQQQGYVPSRLRGTYLSLNATCGWSVWDQILVTKPLLVGDLIHFQEETVRIHQVQERCSDHCMISASFRC